MIITPDWNTNTVNIQLKLVLKHILNFCSNRRHGIKVTQQFETLDKQERKQK